MSASTWTLTTTSEVLRTQATLKVQSLCEPSSYLTLERMVSMERQTEAMNLSSKPSSHVSGWVRPEKTSPDMKIINLPLYPLLHHFVDHCRFIPSMFGSLELLLNQGILFVFIYSCIAQDIWHTYKQKHTSANTDKDTHTHTHTHTHTCTHIDVYNINTPNIPIWVHSQNTYKCKQANNIATMHRRQPNIPSLIFP